MATMYVAWHQWNKKIVGNTTMQVEGALIYSEAVDVSVGGSTNEAPAGTDYAEVWCDVPFYFGPVTGSTIAAKAQGFKPYPASAPVQITNINQTSSKISGIVI